jgi:hypothetical protein
MFGRLPTSHWDWAHPTHICTGTGPAARPLAVCCCCARTYLLHHFAPYGRVPVVLDGVVRPARQQLGDLGPPERSCSNRYLPRRAPLEYLVGRAGPSRRPPPRLRTYPRDPVSTYHHGREPNQPDAAARLSGGAAHRLPSRLCASKSVPAQQRRPSDRRQRSHARCHRDGYPDPHTRARRPRAARPSRKGAAQSLPRAAIGQPLVRARPCASKSNSSTLEHCTAPFFLRGCCGITSRSIARVLAATQAC